MSQKASCCRIRFPSCLKELVQNVFIFGSVSLVIRRGEGEERSQKLSWTFKIQRRKRQFSGWHICVVRAAAYVTSITWWWSFSRIRSPDMTIIRNVITHYACKGVVIKMTWCYHTLRILLLSPRCFLSEIAAAKLSRDFVLAEKQLKVKWRHFFLPFELWNMA